FACAGYITYQFIRGAQVFGLGHPLFFGQYLQAADTIHNGAHMADSLDDIAGASLALGADHRCPFTDTPQCLTEVASATHKGDRKEVFIDMEMLISGRQYF